MSMRYSRHFLNAFLGLGFLLLLAFAYETPSYAQRSSWEKQPPGLLRGEIQVRSQAVMFPGDFLLRGLFLAESVAYGSLNESGPFTGRRSQN